MRGFFLDPVEAGGQLGEPIACIAFAKGKDAALRQIRAWQISAMLFFAGRFWDVVWPIAMRSESCQFGVA